MLSVFRASGMVLLFFSGGAVPGAAQAESHSISFYNPAWSPDGRTITFESNREGTSAVYTVEVETRAVRRLTPADAEAFQPAWSPDGSRIVFGMKRGNATDLYIVDRDGSNLTRIADQPGSQFYASFSPDGRRILFGVQFPERRDVYYVGVVGSDGTGYRLLTDSTASSSGPRWSSDGNRVEFTRTPLLSPAPGEPMRDFFRRRDAASRLLSMRPDGSEARDIGPAPGEEEPSPVESPDGRYVVESKEIGGKTGLYLTEKATGRERMLVGSASPVE
jgi:Tol biopolymer transport system component